MRERKPNKVIVEVEFDIKKSARNLSPLPVLEAVRDATCEIKLRGLDTPNVYKIYSKYEEPPRNIYG
jgi:hypothetical protein